MIKNWLISETVSLFIGPGFAHAKSFTHNISFLLRNTTRLNEIYFLTCITTHFLKN